MATLSRMQVSFDDGTTVEVETKSRDLVRAEQAGVNFTDDKHASSLF